MVGKSDTRGNLLAACTDIIKVLSYFFLLFIKTLNLYLVCLWLNLKIKIYFLIEFNMNILGTKLTVNRSVMKCISIYIFFLYYKYHF